MFYTWIVSHSLAQPREWKSEYKFCMSPFCMYGDRPHQKVSCPSNVFQGNLIVFISFQAPYFRYWTLLEKLWITLALYLLILSETSHPSSSQLSSNWPTLTNRKQSCSVHTWTYDLCDPTSVSSLINIQSQLKLLTLDFDFRYAGWPPGLSPAGPWPPAPPIQPTTV